MVGHTARRQVDSYDGPAAIILKGREPIAVDCHYVVEQDSVLVGRAERRRGKKRWTGTFSTDSAVVTMCEGRLALDDGRSATVIVTTFNLGTGRGSFVGSGEPPE